SLRALASFTTNDGKIVIVGGRSQFKASPSRPTVSEITAYDPQSNTWQDVEKLWRNLLAPAAKIIKDTLYVSHGAAAWNQPLNDLKSLPFPRPS
ncbi:MAG: hypothetical protein HC880_16930, partial [Bacteroidia bacterium]|nr:hypothetical protein [Bacteroidia bacterium]